MLVPLAAVFDPDVHVEFVHHAEFPGAHIALVGDPKVNTLDVLGPNAPVGKHLLAPVTLHGF